MEERKRQNESRQLRVFADNGYKGHPRTNNNGAIVLKLNCNGRKKSGNLAKSTVIKDWN